MSNLEGAKRERILQKLENRYACLAKEVHEGNRTSGTMKSFRRTARIINGLGFGHKISEIAEQVVNRKD